MLDSLENMSSTLTGKAKLESRLLGLCMSNGVDEDLMDLMGEKSFLLEKELSLPNFVFRMISLQSMCSMNRSEQ